MQLTICLVLVVGLAVASARGQLNQPPTDCPSDILGSDGRSWTSIYATGMASDPPYWTADNTGDVGLGGERALGDITVGGGVSYGTHQAMPLLPLGTKAVWTAWDYYTFGAWDAYPSNTVTFGRATVGGDVHLIGHCNINTTAVSSWPLDNGEPDARYPCNLGAIGESVFVADDLAWSLHHAEERDGDSSFVFRFSNGAGGAAKHLYVDNVLVCTTPEAEAVPVCPSGADLLYGSSFGTGSNSVASGVAAVWSNITTATIPRTGATVIQGPGRGDQPMSLSVTGLPGGVVTVSFELLLESVMYGWANESLAITDGDGQVLFQSTWSTKTGRLQCYPAAFPCGGSTSPALTGAASAQNLLYRSMHTMPADSNPSIVPYMVSFDVDLGSATELDLSFSAPAVVTSVAARDGSYSLDVFSICAPSSGGSKPPGERGLPLIVIIGFAVGGLFLLGAVIVLVLGSSGKLRTPGRRAKSPRQDSFLSTEPIVEPSSPTLVAKVKAARHISGISDASVLLERAESTANTMIADYNSSNRGSLGRRSSLGRKSSPGRKSSRGRTSPSRRKSPGRQG